MRRWDGDLPRATGEGKWKKCVSGDEGEKVLASGTDAGGVLSVEAESELMACRTHNWILKIEICGWWWRYTD